MYCFTSFQALSLFIDIISTHVLIKRRLELLLRRKLSFFYQCFLGAKITGFSPTTLILLMWFLHILEDCSFKGEEKEVGDEGMFTGECLQLVKWMLFILHSTVLLLLQYFLQYATVIQRWVEIRNPIFCRFYSSIIFFNEFFLEVDYIFYFVLFFVVFHRSME